MKKINDHSNSQFDVANVAKGALKLLIQNEIVAIGIKNGTVSAQDITLEIPEWRRNTIGATIAGMLEREWLIEVGRIKATRKCSHGRKVNLYALTDKARLVDITASQMTAYKAVIEPDVLEQSELTTLF